MIYLKEANTEDIEKQWLFVRDMPADENGMTNDYHNVSKETFEKTSLPEMIRFSKGEGLPDWMVPETFLFFVGRRCNRRSIPTPTLFMRIFAKGSGAHWILHCSGLSRQGLRFCRVETSS